MSKLKTTKSQMEEPAINQVSEEEKEVIRRAIHKATTNGWVGGAFLLMQFSSLNIPFVYASFFSDTLFAQHYFGKDWMKRQHELLEINQVSGTNAVIAWLKKHNTEKAN